MKTKTYKLEALILFIFLSGAMFGQLTQSKLLNVPVQPGSKYINFRNSTSTTTTAFPINTSHPDYITFLANGGFNYGGWESSIQSIYCGQAPRYASQTITDHDGRLIKFIVDNYIYDANGDFYAYTAGEAYLNHIVTEPSSSPDLESCIYHNIVVMPKNGGCDGHYIFSGTGAANGEFYPGFNIGLYSEKENDYVVKNVIFDTVRSHDHCINYSMTGVYNEGVGDNLLIFQKGSELRIYNVSAFDFDANYFPYKTINLSSDIVYQEPWDISRPDMTISSFDANNYVLATSTIRAFTVGSARNPRNSAMFIKIPKNYASISQSSVEQYYDWIEGQTGTGFEFSPDSKYLYFTVNDPDPFFENIRYYNLTNAINSSNFSLIGGYSSLSSVTGNYKKSELELGRDGKLYAINNNNNTITQIIGVNNAATATGTYNAFSLTCKPMAYQGYYLTQNQAFYFSHQLDGSSYEDYWPINYSSTAINWGVLPYSLPSSTWSPGAANNPFSSESGVVYLNSNLNIPNGKYITLQNMELHFAINTNVTVNTGSTLKLTNSILTSDNSCGTDRMWTGVVLNGNTDSIQSTTYQGRLYMTAPSEISNAICGVNVGSGAICYVSSGIFLNNRSSIRFSPYTNPQLSTYNASLIQSADFIINESLHDGSTPTEQVYLNNVKGIKIYYSDFINSRDNSVLAESRGNAIASTASTKYTVLGSSNMTSYITGFKYGITSTSPAAASIKRVNFNNNYRGVYLVSPTSPIIETNNFNAYDFATSSSYNSSDPNTYPYGCYIYGNGTNTTFTFESNVVTAESPALGLYVNNSGANSNLVRDNVFKGQSSSNIIFYSCINLAKNSNYNNGTGGEKGLQYKCNIFEDYFSALSVVDGNIRRVQGDYVLNNITTYAGNGFDRSTIFTEGDFYVDLNIVPSTLDLGNYTYCSNAEGLVNGYYHKLQNYLSIPVGKVNNIFGTYYETTHCEESTKDGVIIQTLISASEGSELISQIDNEKVLMEYDLALLIDNGNTTQLLTEVENVNPISDDEVSEKVANAEGYISDEVALTYLENDNANQYAKAEALLANSPLPSNIVAEIENAPMDDNLKSLLILNQNGINAREAKEMQIGEMHQNRSLVVNAMVRGYWDENASDENRSQLKDFLVSDNEILSQQHLFDIYLYEKNYTAASECLAKIEDLAYICNMDYIIELENNNNVLRLMMEIEQGNISLDEAVAQNIDLLRSMKSENEVAGSVYAAILLDKARIEPMTEVIRLPEPAVEQKNAIVDKSSNFNTSFSDLVNIYPNPASDFVYVEYILTDVNNYKSVNLYNASGSLIKSYLVSQKAGYVKIDVNGLSAGTYVVSIGENGGKFSKQIVVK